MSLYFSYFPKLLYDIDNTKSFKLVTDIIRRVKVREGILNSVFIFDKYDVVSGEKPEDVSFKQYGTQSYYYQILLLNNIKDRYYDWPLSDQAFEEYVTNKYANPYGIHHYEKIQSSGSQSGNGPNDYDHFIEVNSTEPGALSVSNYEYERRLQDQKRQIKLLKKSYCQSFETEFIKTIRK